MRRSPVFLLIAGLTTLAGCSRGLDVEIANNDSAGLAEAIRQANASPGDDTIRLARNGLYVLATPALPGLLLPPLEGGVTIEGNHAEIRGYSSKPAALMEVANQARVQITNVVLAEGTDGTLRNYGALRLDNVAIVDSSVSSAPAIVLNHGQLHAIDSQFAYNLLLANRRDAGTLLNYGQLEFERSRIHDNRTIGRQPTTAAAGAVLNFGTVEVDGLMIHDNELAAEDAPRMSFGGILNLGNGRVTGTTPAGSVRDAGHEAMFVGF